MQACRFRGIGRGRASWTLHADQPKITICATRILPLPGILLLGGCAGRQSALAPGGKDPAQVYLHFLVMLGDAVALWLGLNGLFLYFIQVDRGHFARRPANRIIIGAGVHLPIVVVGALLAWGLTLAARSLNHSAKNLATRAALTAAPVAALDGGGLIALSVLDLSPSSRVYPAIICALVIWTAAHVLVGVLMQSYCLSGTIFWQDRPRS